MLSPAAGEPHQICCKQCVNCVAFGRFFASTIAHWLLAAWLTARSPAGLHQLPLLLCALVNDAAHMCFASTPKEILQCLNKGGEELLLPNSVWAHSIIQNRFVYSSVVKGLAQQAEASSLAPSVGEFDPPLGRPQRKNTTQPGSKHLQPLQGKSG